MSHSILALDLGTRLGWAIRRASGRIESGDRNFTPDGGEPEGLRFLRFRCWLHDLKARIETAGDVLGLIRFERVDFIRPGQVYSAHVWGGMWATLTCWAAHHQIPCEPIAVATIKKAATGHGRATPMMVTQAMRSRGFNPLSDDEAVALAVLHTKVDVAA